MALAAAANTAMTTGVGAVSGPRKWGPAEEKTPAATKKRAAATVSQFRSASANPRDGWQRRRGFDQLRDGGPAARAGGNERRRCRCWCRAASVLSTTTPSAGDPARGLAKAEDPDGRATEEEDGCDKGDWN